VVLRVSLIEVPQIEHANIVNLDWALAHMDAVKSKKTRRKTGTAEDWVYEAEMKDTGEDVGAVLHYSPKVRLMPTNTGGPQGSRCPPLGRQYVPRQIPEH
jgi:hypothetical protein